MTNSRGDRSQVRLILIVYLFFWFYGRSIIATIATKAVTILVWAKDFCITAVAVKFNRIELHILKVVNG